MRTENYHGGADVRMVKLQVKKLIWVRGHQDIEHGGQSKVQPDSFATRQ
jgi:hypothetical protein